MTWPLSQQAQGATILPPPVRPARPDFSQVRDKFAPITCISPSPSGHFMAVGTATGATVVFDLRNEPSNPWFEVCLTSAQLPRALRGGVACVCVCPPSNSVFYVDHRLRCAATTRHAHCVVALCSQLFRCRLTTSAVCLPPLLLTTALCNACTLHPATLLLPLLPSPLPAIRCWAMGSNCRQEACSAARGPTSLLLRV